MLECIRLARYLRGGPDTLWEVCRRALSALLPSAISQPFLESLDVGAHDAVISPSLLRRYEVSLDMSLLLCRQELYDEHAMRWSKCDSSPQARYNWLWFEFKEVLISLKLGLNDQELDEMVKDCDSEFDVACLRHITHNTQDTAQCVTRRRPDLNFLTWRAARCSGSSSPLQRTATVRSTTASSCR